jgi:FkbM family methyltransferase
MFHTPAIFNNIRFLRKLSFSTFRRYAELFKSRYSVERRMGVSMLLDKMDKVDLNLLCGGIWESDRIDYLKTAILSQMRPEKRTVFLDIGSHGALYSLVLAKHINFDRIIAFEPEPVGIAQINANVMMNDLCGRLEIVPKAVSASSGVAKFLVAHESNRGQSRIVEADHPASGSTIDVQITSIDDMLDESDTFLIAKIDVEGHETEVISGMKNTIAHNFVIIQVEINNIATSNVEKLLFSHGFKMINSIEQDYYFLKTEITAGFSKSGASTS